jgi:hypothetical protein
MMKIGANEWRGCSPQDRSPVLFHGGCDERSGHEKLTVIANMGGDGTTVSFAAYQRDRVGFEKALEVIEARNLRFIVQPGIYSQHQGRIGLEPPLTRREERALVKKYANFLKTLQGIRRQPDFYLTYDVYPTTPAIIRTTKWLQEMGFYPVPILYDGASGTEIEQLLDGGHKLIAISKQFYRRGNKSRKFYEYLFSLTEARKIAVHGISVSLNMLGGLPWYSISSTDAVRHASYYKVYCWYRGRVGQVKLGSNREGPFPTDVIELAKSIGLTASELRIDWRARLKYNIYFEQNMLLARQPKCTLMKPLF